MDIEYTDRYTTTPEGLAAALVEHGVAVLPSVLDAAECARFKDGMWDYLEHATSGCQPPISRRDPASWGSLKHLGPKHGMLLQHHGVGQCQALWDLRTNPKVVGVFSSLYQCRPEDLVTSFDGASVWLPRPNNAGVRRAKTVYDTALHIDQRYADSGFKTVQSWLTAYDVNPGDATLYIIPGSHAHHRAAAVALGEENCADDWVRMTRERLDYYLSRGMRPVGIKCPAGSMTLWDSRAVHCGIEPTKDQGAHKRRLVGYVCMQPRSECDAKTLKRRIKTFEDGRSTSHMPSAPRSFPMAHRLYPGDANYDIQRPPPPEIGALGRRLVGYE